MRLLLAAVLLLAACGSGQQDQCTGSISVVPFNPVAPVILSASADITISDPMLSGVKHATWVVTGPDGQPASVTLLDPDGITADIDAPVPGTYSISLYADVGGTGCGGDQLDLEVGTPSTNFHELVLHYAPPAATGIPAQDDPSSVITRPGIDVILDPRRLLAGRQLSGSFFGPDGPLAGSLELSPMSGGDAVTLFAGVDGSYGALIADEGPWQLTAVPYDMQVPPEQRQGVATSDLDAAITLTGGSVLDGSVLDGNGQVVSGATVRVAQPGLPGQVASTDGLGHFSVHARTGTPLVIDVVPPAAGGLPGLALPATTDITADGGTLLVALPLLAALPVSATVRDAGGNVLPFAQVRFELTSSGDATITQAGVDHPAPLAVVRDLVATGSGDVSTMLPAGTYRVRVEPQPGNQGDQRLADSEVVIAAPVSLDLTTRTAVTMPVFVVDGVGSAVVGATVEASVAGAGGGAPPVERAVTSATGAVTFDLPPDQMVTLVVRPAAGHAPVQVTIPVVAVGATVTVPAARTVSGRVLSPSGASLGGVAVRASCLTCTDEIPEPVASTVTDGAGRWTLTVPEPAQ